MPAKSKHNSGAAAAASVAKADKEHKKTQQILNPKQTGMKDDNKPLAVIIHSPNDGKDAKDMKAVEFKGAKASATDAGYAVINQTKERILWNTQKIETLIKINEQTKQKSLTIWVEAHGAPGWFFGNSEQKGKDEFQRTAEFSRLVRTIEQLTQAKETNVILNGCYTGVEISNPNQTQFFRSPARMLSMLLPNALVVGFIGHNANAKIDHVYEYTKDGYVKKPIALDKAAIVFKKGDVRESYTETLYCDHQYTPEFIKNQCGIEVGDGYFASCHASISVNKIDKQHDKHLYAARQVRFVEQELIKLNEAVKKVAEIEALREKSDPTKIKATTIAVATVPLRANPPPAAEAARPNAANAAISPAEALVAARAVKIEGEAAAGGGAATPAERAAWLAQKAKAAIAPMESRSVDAKANAWAAKSSTETAIITDKTKATLLAQSAPAADGSGAAASVAATTAAKAALAAAKAETAAIKAAFATQAENQGTEARQVSPKL